MFLGDKGKPYAFHRVTRNYDILVDNEQKTLQKLGHELGFFNIIPLERFREVEIVYDTDRKLFTGAGLLLRKKITKERTYFSLVRLSAFGDAEEHEKKNFLGECEPNDQPADFPVQIADGINRVFNNLFTVDVVELVKHSSPYIQIDVQGNRYKIVSGTGMSGTIQFETLSVRDARTGRKAKLRNCALIFELDPNYERERAEVLDAIDRKCKELVPLKRNRFQIAEVAVKIREPKAGEKKKSKKEIKEEQKKKEAEKKE